MKNIVIVCFLMLTACGSDEKYTWGDVYRTLVTEFCAFQKSCAYFETQGDADKWEQQCIKHSMYHRCELEEGCDTVLAESAEEAVDVCVEAMHQPEYAEECLFAYYGILPEACGPVWDYEPQPEE